MLPGLREGRDKLCNAIKSIEKFSELPPLGKRKFLVKKLGTRVDDLFLDEKGEVMADSQKNIAKSCKYY